MTRHEVFGWTTNVGRKVHADSEASDSEQDIRYVRLARFSFLILIGRFVTLEP